METNRLNNMGNPNVTSPNATNVEPSYPGTLIRVGSRGSGVLLMQKYLNNISNRYPSIPKLSEDGVFGVATQNAVRTFQRQFGLTPDGIIGPMTWNKIVNMYNGNTQTPEYPEMLLSIGSRGKEVLTMQQYLNRISNNFPSIPKIIEDGIYGPATANAVAAFQRQFGLIADGIIGPATWKKIMDVLNSGSNGNVTGPEASTGELTADELEVFNLINQQRVNNGLSALQIDPQVQNVARIKAQDMVNNNYFSHTSPTYGSPFDMLNSFGVSYRAAGENIAGNSRNSAAVTGWMNSPGHRANILNEGFDYTGIGVVNDPRYGKIFVQMFIGR